MSNITYNNYTNETMVEEIINDAPILAYFLLLVCIFILFMIWIRPMFTVCFRKKIRDESRPNVHYNTDECCFCLENIKNMVEVCCGHAFCAKCITDYWRRNSNSSAMLSCPVCRRQFACLFKSYKNDAEQPSPEIEQAIDEYNDFYAPVQIGFCQVLKDFPMMLKTFSRRCCTAGMLCKSLCMIALTIAVIVYIISPYDIFPESIFGIFGYIDDVSVLLYIIFFIGKILIAAIFRERN